MSDQDKPHHPLPKDDRARHDLIPESIENESPQGDDDPYTAPASNVEPPKRQYRDPDGRPYDV